MTVPGYKEIIKRLEAAEGADRELDADIFRALGEPLPKEFMDHEVDLEWREDGTAVMTLNDEQMQVTFTPPPNTASRDAVVALQERVLPGWGRQTIISEDGTADVQLCPPNGAPGPGPAEHKSEPIAHLIALFKALEMK